MVFSSFDVLGSGTFFEIVLCGVDFGTFFVFFYVKDLQAFTDAPHEAKMIKGMLNKPESILY